jgi:hypothetical protein
MVLMASVWLLTGENAQGISSRTMVFWADSDHDNEAEIVKNLVACWPNPPDEIASVQGSPCGNFNGSPREGVP